MFGQEWLWKGCCFSGGYKQCYINLCLHPHLCHPGIQGPHQLCHLSEWVGVIKWTFIWQHLLNHETSLQSSCKTFIFYLVCLISSGKADANSTKTNDQYVSLVVTYSNILALTNEFDIGDMNITVENYEQWFDSLNGTQPSRVSDLNLKTCDLQTFLDQVLYSGVKLPQGNNKKNDLRSWVKFSWYSTLTRCIKEANWLSCFHLSPSSLQSASGTGLAFIVFTEAVISMPGSQVWADPLFYFLYYFFKKKITVQIQRQLCVEPS